MKTNSDFPNPLNETENLFLKVRTQSILEYTRRTEKTVSYFLSKKEASYFLDKMRNACNLRLWEEAISYGLKALKQRENKSVTLLLAYAYSRINNIEKSLFYIQKVDGLEFEKVLNSTELYFLSRVYLLYAETGRDKRLLVEFGELLQDVAQSKKLKITKQIKQTILNERLENNSTINSLTLNETDLRHFPPAIKELKALIHLDLKYNKIKKFQWKIWDLERNKIEEFPLERLDLKDLVELNLDFNELSCLPVEIRQMSNLMKLDLGYNKFTSFPLELLKLDKLVILDFQYNKITTLPKEIGQLTNLASLNLANNEINDLPAEISQLKNLSSLQLNENELRTLPSEIGELNQLRSLQLYNNRLKRLPNSIEKLRNLEDLYLTANQIGRTERERIKSLLPNCKITF